MMLLAVWSFLFLMELQSFVHTKEECAIKEMLAKYESGGTELFEDFEVPNADACYEECCKRAADGCNAASFFRIKGKVVCKSIQCTPHFDSCKWEIDEGLLLHDEFSAEIVMYKSNVTLPPVLNQNASAQGNASAVTPDMDKYYQQIQNELENNEDKIFKNNKPDEQWNIDYNGQTTSGWLGNAFTSTPFVKNEEVTTAVDNNKEQGGQGKTGNNANEGSAAPTGNGVNKGNVATTNNGQSSQSTENTGGNNNVNAKPHLSHGNSGIYGPSEVEDYDYSATPLIVIGAVVTVLFMLIVLICVGRKLSASERLKYRPLRDSFPASNSYHDID